jgi:hypothetical protein
VAEAHSILLTKGLNDEDKEMLRKMKEDNTWNPAGKPDDCECILLPAIAHFHADRTIRVKTTVKKLPNNKILGLLLYDKDKILVIRPTEYRTWGAYLEPEGTDPLKDTDLRDVDEMDRGTFDPRDRKFPLPSHKSMIASWFFLVYKCELLGKGPSITSVFNSRGT